MNNEARLIRKNIASALLSIAGHDDTKVEVEVRFGYPNYRERNVPQQVWYNLYSDLMAVPESRSYAIAGSSQKMTDIIVNGDKGSLRRTIGIGKPKEVVKYRYGININKQYSYKTAVSTERIGFTDRELEFFDSQIPSLVRIKERFSFYIGSYLRVDMTIVKPPKKEQSKRDNTYEVELELRVHPDKLNAIEILIKGTGWLLKKLLRTTIMYSLSERNKLVKFLNGKMGEPYTGGVNSSIYNYARDLKYNDLIDGGILGYSNTLKKNIGYTITHKADGERKMLVVFEESIWYVIPPFFTDKIRDDFRGSDVILDGESVIIKPEFDNAGKSLYLIIDVISMKTENWLERHKYSLQQSEILRKAGLMVYTKNFEVFYTADSFFRINRKLLDLSDSLAFKTDGLIFTPINTPYKSYTKELSPRKRILSIWPDIIKYKLPKDLTIDFKVEKNERMKIILKVTLPKGNLGIFTGTQRYPLKRSMINHKELLSHVGKIVELEWKRGENDKDGKFSLRGVRTFKPSPNRSDVAREIWNNMHDPITATTITGEDLILLFKNNNRIKRELIKRINKGSVILDIGSGVGGDVDKWKSAELDRVYAIEPDEKKLVELRRRRKTTKMEKIITIIPYRAENINKIAEALDGRKVDYVTMMVSLSLFKDFKIIRVILSKFLKVTGSFIYVTIDGDALLETFKPQLNITGLYISIDSFKYGDFSLRRLDENRVHIEIKGSKTAEKQDEYLVDVTRLHKELYQDGFISIFRERADKETFMSIEAFKVSNLYSYGIFSIKKSIHNLIRKVESIGPTIHPFNGTDIEETRIPVQGEISMFYTSKSKKKRGVIQEILPAFIEEKTSEVNKAIPDYSAIHLSETSGTGEESIISLVEPENPPHPLPALNEIGKVKRAERIEHPTIEYPRKVLPVTPNITMKIAMGDDINDQLSDKRFAKIKVVRIAVIDEGFSLFHSTLKAINYSYQKNNSYMWRRDLAKNLDESRQTRFGTDSDNLGQISELMNIGIYVITPYKDYINILEKYEGSPIIVLSWTSSWEVISIESDKFLYKTVFDKDDSFIKILDDSFSHHM
uniref:mRNA 5'-phosphatase n=1 Tax=Pithovirus LCPAC401 TaxID=2506595 RepID=A0A481Z9U0_9VIRU|nr:MAG: mRNA capping enzyme [Pithovirus LCPAC401]